MGKNKRKGVNEALPKQLPVAAPEDEENDEEDAWMSDDDSWDSDDEEMLNMDDIFGDDGGDESESSAANNPKMISFQNDIGLSASDVHKLKELREKKEENKRKKNENTTSNITSHRKAPEIVVFHDPTQRKQKSGPETMKKSQADSNQQSNRSQSAPEMDLKAARHEVHKFGLKGLQHVDKEQAMQELLIKLGAKPPKKTYINYKDLIEKKREDREKLRQMKSSNKFADAGKIEAIQSLAMYKKRFLNKKKGKGQGPVDGLSTGRSGVHKVKERNVKKFSQSKVQQDNRRPKHMSKKH